MSVFEGFKKPSKKKCCVPGCNDQDSSRFCFPRKMELDSVQIWLQAIAKLFNLPFKTLYQNHVCSRHFRSNQLQYGTRRGIEPNAVASLFLPKSSKGMYMTAIRTIILNIVVAFRIFYSDLRFFFLERIVCLNIYAGKKIYYFYYQEK